MEKSGIVKWLAMALHGIPLLFTVLVAIAFAEGSVLTLLALSASDTQAHRSLLLCGLLIGGNALGITLLMTSLINSRAGSYVLAAYELGFLALCLIFISPAYGVVIAFTAGMLCYAALTQTRGSVRS